MVDRIELKALSKSYHSREGRFVTVLEDASLLIPAGQVCGLVGANGAGKSTVLRVIAGLVPFTSGNIRLNGYDLVQERSNALGRLSAVMEGQPYQRGTPSVEQTMLDITPEGEARHSAQERSRHLLRQLGLWDWRDEPLDQLSRGMQKMVALARALVTDPSILLLDEPLEYLDLQMAGLAASWIKWQAADRDTAILLATRQAEVAQALCERVVVMHHGRFVADQSMAELPRLLPGEHYEIRIKGQLDAHRAAWFDELQLITEGEQTVLSGVVPDQAALQGIIAKVRDLGIPLLSITHNPPEPKQALIHLMYSPPREWEHTSRNLRSKEALI